MHQIGQGHGPFFLGRQVKGKKKCERQNEALPGCKTHDD
jgi:hypothetical protein